MILRHKGLHHLTILEWDDYEGKGEDDETTMITAQGRQDDVVRNLPLPFDTSNAKTDLMNNKQ